ncbi:unnamed protein product [Chrysodeixis includens]|uniref:Uncharacterized protein n=1 Tax=Chrysodeixis includens TaxID=689277 RepID=A0A9P0BWF8_CHRIL|nr:unnamed protein product [Chrysodeixis includens]
MSIIIHKTSVSPPARATLMLARILGLNVETREVNLPTREQFKHEYLMKNPMHTVPLLEDDGFVLADSHAIMTYLTSKYGEKQQELYPKDVAARAIVDQRLFFDASILFPRLRSVIYSVVKYKAPGATDEQIADIVESYFIADKYLEATRYMAGDALTLADISCVATISSLNSIVEIDAKYVKLREWWARLQEEDWYQQENEPGLRLFDEHIAHVEDYTNTTQWMALDIGVATVEKPYDFEDISFKIYCSYVPTTIQINYNTHLDDMVGTNVVALGWGRDRGGMATDVVDRNSDTLREASMKIKEKEYCIKKFQGNAVTEMIEKYMICAHGKGLLDGEGFFIEDNTDKKSDKCVGSAKRRTIGGELDECLDDNNRRRFRSVKAVENNTVRIEENKDLQKIKRQNATKLKPGQATRRQGICQNDHGGPLITWVGSTELLIGVAVNSLYDENFECVGPYLFTSTSVAGQIVRCLLANEQQTLRNCQEAENEGYVIFEQYVHRTEGGVMARSNVAPQPVYLLSSNYSGVQPRSWLCGGALVSPSYVLTSAACLKEISHVYVIAGYKKYVIVEKIDEDECTRLTKRRIVTKVLPAGFSLGTWYKNDVAIGVVDRPYDFYNMAYKVICSYVPGSISINFQSNYERENTHAVVYGWGGDHGREPGRLNDLNSRYMKEGRTIVTDPSVCSSRMALPMEANVLCAYGAGFMTSDGRDVNPIELYDDCARRFNLDEDATGQCLDDDAYTHSASRRAENQTKIKTIDEPNRNKSDFNVTNQRRQQFKMEPSSGNCWNDHGGPLVSWIGKTEILIGVALNSLYTANYECQGPFLFISTSKSKDLLQCLLNSENEQKRQECKEKRHSIEVIAVQWPDSNPNNNQF